MNQPQITRRSLIAGLAGLPLAKFLPAAGLLSTPPQPIRMIEYCGRMEEVLNGIVQEELGQHGEVSILTPHSQHTMRHCYVTANTDTHFKCKLVPFDWEELYDLEPRQVRKMLRLRFDKPWAVYKFTPPLTPPV